MFSFQLEGWEELQRALDRIDDRLTHKTRMDALRSAATVIRQRAAELCPEGDPAHMPEKPPLATTIDYALRDYGQRGLAYVGPVYPQGAHGHLVEFGHQEVLYGVRTGRRVPPHPFLRPAFDETKHAQRAAMEAAVARTISELGI